MASVEEIQKVNELAQELLKNKVASSLDDAMVKAQNILSISLGPMMNSTNRGVNQSEEQPNENPAIEKPAEQPTVVQKNNHVNTNYLTKEELQKEITQLKETLNLSLKNLYEQVQKMITQNNNEMMSKVKTSSSIAPKIEPKQESNNEVEQITIEETPEKEELHPKQGNFKPGNDNVDIQKIFYFGNK